MNTRQPRRAPLLAALALLLGLAAGFAAADNTGRNMMGAGRTLAELEAAFAADGYKVTNVVTAPGSGARGLEATSLNVTLLSSGAPKRVFYVEGSASDLGTLQGLLLEPEAAVMATDYINHFIPNMISWAFDDKASYDPTWGKLYNLTVSLLGDLLIYEANNAFNGEAPGTIPPALVAEMRAFAAAAATVNPATPVTLERLITLNYGLDWLSANVFSGALIDKLKAFAATRLAAEDVRLFDLLSHGDLQVPTYCDAVLAGKPATLSGEDAYMARAFQLATGLVFQDLQTTIIYNPFDGRLPLASATAPGLVGSITAMNAAGFAMGVDTLRSSEADAAHAGLNAILLVRATTHVAHNTSEAADYVAAARRGCPYLYPMNDMNGDPLVLETAKFLNATTPPDTTQMITDPTLKALLPTAAMLANVTQPRYSNGIFIRDPSYVVSSEISDLNNALFGLANMTINPNAWSLDGMLFSNWTTENASWKALGSRYFSSTRAAGGVAGGMKHVLVVSNFALSPTLRITEMTPGASAFAGEAMQWRYDSLNRLAVQYYGKMTFDVMKHIITFLAPDRSPGYWIQRFNETDPMSAEVQGSITVADLGARVMQVKGGYWADEWTQITLPNYV